MCLVKGFGYAGLVPGDKRTGDLMMMQNDQVLHDMIVTIYQERRPKYQDRNRSPGQIQKLRTTIITTDELFLCDIDYY